MNKFIETIKNIWKIDELRGRILFTLLILAVYRLGSFIVLPGVNPDVLDSASSGSAGQGLLGLINIFTGGAFNKGAIFALGIMPYITASIIIQLLGFAVPYFQRLQQKEGESGRKKITQITRMLTVAITLVQVIMGGILEPIFMGKTFSLNIITVLVMLMLWGYIWGVPGLIKSIPITVVIKIIFEQFPNTRIVAGLMSGHGVERNYPWKKKEKE